ncbi:endolytic transglycosylase MltG [Candidatus Nomurabacteria bacterium]|nr:endolytic transglycosylase MltG [Candidatus Nomurabacteria bacterium]
MDFFSANRVSFYVLGTITFLLLFYSFFFSPPRDFPTETIVKIEQGKSLRSVSLKLKNEHIIRSRLIFEAFVILLDKERRVIEADYYFENKLSVWRVAERISNGEHHMAPIIVTIPEGFDVAQIADTFSSKLENFNKNKFLLEAKGLEGKLFPDTYFFLNTDTEIDVIKSMSANFEKKIIPIRPAIINSKKTEREIVIMASLIEGEAKGENDRGFISGILWRRLDLGMLLQVDVELETYKTKGLPKSPISNPGLRAIQAAIYPQKSPYLYYLHDKAGEIHYAKSFIEHQANIKKYLK